MGNWNKGCIETEIDGAKVVADATGVRVYPNLVHGKPKRVTYYERPLMTFPAARRAVGHLRDNAGKLRPSWLREQGYLARVL